MKRVVIGWICVMAMLLSGCGNTPDSVPSSGESGGDVVVDVPPVEVDTGPMNSLTGLPIDEEWVDARPIAIMLNNLKEAQPQQGNSQADIIYETVTEGGITRMLGVYQTVDGVDIIGSVRSSRPCFLEFALGHDAVYIHAGGSDEAYSKISSWGVDNLDGVRGKYSHTDAGLFWRDQNRIAGKHYSSEHALITSGEAVQKAVNESISRTKHEADYTYVMEFVEDGTPVSGETAMTITVPFSKYKTGLFRYDASAGVYLAEQYGSAYIDGNSGAQIAVENVLILQATVQNSGDSYGHTIIDLSKGDGWFACGGKIIPISWEKGGQNEQFRYYTESGETLALGQGKSYVSIIPTSKEVTYE